MWPIKTTEVFDDWFADLDEAAQVEVIAVVGLLKQRGPHLGRPHADNLKGSKHANMKELRAATPGKVLRIAFAFDPRRAGVLLVAGDKVGVSQRRFYKQLIAKADELYDAHLTKLKAKKKEK